VLGALMNDSYNLINKDDNFVLKALSCLSELADAADAEYQLDPLPRAIQIHTCVGLSQVIRDDYGTQFTKASL
jgi:hypothetical protein